MPLSVAAAGAIFLTGDDRVEPCLTWTGKGVSDNAIGKSCVSLALLSPALLYIRVTWTPDAWANTRYLFNWNGVGPGVDIC